MTDLTTTAVYAAQEKTSRGRRYAELASRHRGEFARDRDRIIHSTAFRRLEYKTQVFVNHEGDLYRTRLTHSLEVAQIGRTVARALQLNEDLTEAICLAHDLGHTPFGHAGQHALNDCMRDFGGFEHNLQSLRVVDKLEEKYPKFSGLNLTYETREGILKHCSARNARELGDIGERFLRNEQAGLEAQLANIADEIAYNNHDVDDGLRSGLLDEQSLLEVELFRDSYATTGTDYPNLSGRIRIYETVRRMIGVVVNDLIETTRLRLAELAPASIDEVRLAGQAMVGMSETTLARHRELKRYLHSNLYRHADVCAMTDNAEETVRALFAAFIAQPERLPLPYADAAREQPLEQVARLVADYIAGMTDRYALTERARVAPQ